MTLSKRKVCRLFRFVRLLINVSQLGDGRSITLLPQVHVLANRRCSSSCPAARRRFSGLFAYHLRHMLEWVLSSVDYSYYQHLWADRLIDGERVLVTCPSGGGLGTVRVWPKEIMFTARADGRRHVWVGEAHRHYFAPKWKETEYNYEESNI